VKNALLWPRRDRANCSQYGGAGHGKAARLSCCFNTRALAVPADTQSRAATHRFPHNCTYSILTVRTLTYAPVCGTLTDKRRTTFVSSDQVALFANSIRYITICAFMFHFLRFLCLLIPTTRPPHSRSTAVSVLNFPPS
jgi:hypothetical protein